MASHLHIYFYRSILTQMNVSVMWIKTESNRGKQSVLAWRGHRLSIFK